MFVGGPHDEIDSVLAPLKVWTRRRLQLALANSLLIALFSACSQAIDWREMRPAGAHLRMAMPCRPASHQRNVALAGESVEMTLLACQVDAGTFAVAFAELKDPARVSTALRALVDAARANVQGQVLALSPAQVPGMTPQPEARRWLVEGKLPDGRAVVSQGLVFAHGTRVYQATIVGEKIADEAVGTFLDALAIQP